jgi:hypothetical protein
VRDRLLPLLGLAGLLVGCPAPPTADSGGGTPGADSGEVGDEGGGDEGGGGDGYSGDTGAWDGERLYQFYCQPCHGDDGSGSMLGPDITERVWDFTDAELLQIILEGTDGMSPINLEEDEASLVVGWIRESFPLASE